MAEENSAQVLEDRLPSECPDKPILRSIEGGLNKKPRKPEIVGIYVQLPIEPSNCITDYQKREFEHQQRKMNLSEGFTLMKTSDGEYVPIPYSKI